MYSLQHRVLAHTEQQAIKGPKITSVKPFKQENQRSNLYKIKKRETRNKYKFHKQTTTTVHQILDLGQVQTFAAGLNLVYFMNDLKKIMCSFNVTSSGLVVFFMTSQWEFQKKSRKCDVIIKFWPKRTKIKLNITVD